VHYWLNENSLSQQQRQPIIICFSYRFVISHIKIYVGFPNNQLALSDYQSLFVYPKLYCLYLMQIFLYSNNYLIKSTPQFVVIFMSNFCQSDAKSCKRKRKCLLLRHLCNQMEKPTFYFGPEELL